MATKVQQTSPERVRPFRDSGRLIASEHCARYVWAAQFASGKNTLDAGCGTGYGTKILADAGASSVVGIDISEAALSDARATYGSPDISLTLGDIRSLPFSDDEFDLIVCFEVIEHIEDQGTVLDELARVLVPNGVLCISTPNSRVYPPGNPHHVHEYEPEEFASSLRERFPQVELYRQSAWLGSGILSEKEFSKTGADREFPGHIIKLDDKGPGEEIFTIALASWRPLTSADSFFALGDPFEVRWWQEQIDDGQKRAEATVNESLRQLHQANQAALEAHNRAVDSAKRLLEAEEIISGLNGRIYRLEEELGIRLDRINALTERADRADRVLASMKNSISWRVTRPLRAIRRRP